MRDMIYSLINLHLSGVESKGSLYVALSKTLNSLLINNSHGPDVCFSSGHVR